MNPKRLEAIRAGVAIREGDGTTSKTHPPYSKPVLRLDAAARAVHARDVVRDYDPEQIFDPSVNRRFYAAAGEQP